jgi:molecular chaperone HtpG
VHERLEIPVPFLTLLSGSSLEAPTLAFADVASAVLRDNKTPFFPAYTDHGTDHIESVLRACVRLIPRDVLEQTDDALLRPTDAAVLICAALLHDIAMHLREPGFVELVSPTSPFLPVPWFATRHDDRPADVPWPVLWEAFRHEVRHFGQSQLDRVLGPANAGVPAVVHEAALTPDAWTDADRLVIGEFLRRHHARLSHEIARDGFPGAQKDMGPLPSTLADAAGTVARSHGEPLRLMLSYLNFKYGGNLRPAGAVQPYLMGLLRVADYLQLDAARAPAVLLRLKDLQATQSLVEWNKHGAVANISWEDRDLGAIAVDVNGNQGLRTHLALDGLFRGLEDELTTTTTVLSEIYGSTPLERLRLSRQRVRTNLHSQALADELAFVPRRAALRSDEDLFRLVIDDLYGRQPAVAGRELTQNAVDAVRERRRLELVRGRDFPSDAFREQAAEVVVTLEEVAADEWVLRVTDRGVGMTPDTVIDYFLRAGASFGPKRQERARLPEGESVRAMKSGRFGVGAFAAFLLGPELRVTTRHVEAQQGVTFTAGIDEDLVELRWCRDVPVGTEVVVPVDGTRVRERPEDLIAAMAELYCLEDPSVAFRLTRFGEAAVAVSAPDVVPMPHGGLIKEWREMSHDGFDAIFWKADVKGLLVHNGIAVREPSGNRSRSDDGDDWADGPACDLLTVPSLAVFDTRNVWPLALHRYWPVDSRLPFEPALLEAIGRDLVPQALVEGPRTYPLGRNGGLSPVMDGGASWLPMWPELVERYCRGTLLVMWTGGKPGRPSNLVELARRIGEGRPERTWAVRGHRTRRAITRPLGDQIRLWGAWLNAEPVATVQAQVSSKSLGDTSVPGKATKRVVDGWDVLTTVAEDGRDAHLAQAMIDVLPAVRPSAQLHIAMTAYRIDGAVARAAGASLAKPWIDLVGGPLPTDADEREEVADRLVADHPELQSAIVDWQRRAHGAR